MKSESETPLGRSNRTAQAVRRSGISYSFILLLVLVSILAPGNISARSQTKTAAPLKQDENCLACHGQPGMTAANGKSISIDPGKHAASVHGILGCTDCHQTIKDYPHPARVAKVKCATCHDDEASHVPQSVHSALGATACQSCHGMKSQLPLR